jgi:hypothetical protein
MILGLAIATSSKNSLRLNLTRYELVCCAAKITAVVAAVAILSSPPLVFCLALLMRFPLIFIGEAKGEEDDTEYEQGVDHLTSDAEGEARSGENDTHVK